MLLTLTTTHTPATDLGFLLHKHPERVHQTDLTVGRALAFYSEASDERCTACLSLDIDPIALVRGRKDARGTGLLDHYVNDRPYAASSFLSVALARTFREAMAGRSKERPDLAATPIPLEATITPLPCRGGDAIVRRLFEPLGYEVRTSAAALDPAHPEWGESPYRTLTLTATTRLSELLTHLYVLIPVLDNRKHYWVGPDEVEKLVSKGGDWLAAHPDRELIAGRYLRWRGYAREAIVLLDERLGVEADDTVDPGAGEDALEQPMRLNEQRYEAVVAALSAEGVTSVADLGCGEGKLVKRLMQERTMARIVGVDVSAFALDRAARTLNLERMSPTQRGRVDLMHGSLVYEDDRLKGLDAVTLVEVIEHVDAERLDAVERVVFARLAPRIVIVTTPNREFNAAFDGMEEGALRHSDHRFEWTRDEFRAWADGVAGRNGYTARIEGIGETQAQLGAPTQMAVFRKGGA